MSNPDSINISTPNVRAMKRGRMWRFRLAALALSLLVCFGLAEVSLRLWFGRTLPSFDDERTLMYRFDESLGWLPVANSTHKFTGARTITAHHNSKGFRGPEPIVDEQPGIMFLGDSFV